MKNRLRRIVLLVGTVLAFAGNVQAEDKKKEKDSAKSYPLDKCIVTDEKLGDHGKPYVFTHEKQEIKLCCKSCLKDFKKEPSKYIKKVDESAKKEKK